MWQKCAHIWTLVIKWCIVGYGTGVLVKYPTMHHFVTEWCIVGYGAGALWGMWLVHCGIESETPVRLHTAPSTAQPQGPWYTSQQLDIPSQSQPLLLWSISTLNVRGPSYLGLTMSISRLLMPWLLMSPGHQQQWYWLCGICRSWSYLRKDFKYMCHINVE